MPRVLAAVAFMAGCVTNNGPSFDAVTKTAGPPKAGHARVFVLREPGSGGIMDITWDVRVDGVPMGPLKAGTFVYRDVPAGRHKLTFEQPATLTRSSHHELAAVPGRTYYFRLAMNEKGGLLIGAQAAAGLAGYFVASAISDGSDERGIYDFVPVEDTAMAGLVLAE
jgi:Protein of unknown function (DUF2846)